MLNKQVIRVFKENENLMEEALEVLFRTGQLTTIISNNENKQDDINLRANGKILMFGVTKVKKNQILATAKKMGLSKTRFQFVLDYAEAKKFNIRKILNSWRYAAVIVGAVPHSAAGRGDYSSIVTTMRNEEGYPPVVFDPELSKTGFENIIKGWINDNTIAA